jgi:3-phenylpropionate/trans-cinnamate dioxygenase ferredoxin subunit
VTTDTVVCRTTDVPDGTACRFLVDGKAVCLAHIGDEWFAIGDTCSHEDYSLTEGDLWPDECEIECPKHGSMFSLRTGEPQTLPATRSVPLYGVRVDGDDVVVAADGVDERGAT